MEIRLVCKSVAGGWRTGIDGTDILIGPTFNRFSDLCEWHREYVSHPQQEAPQELATVRAMVREKLLRTLAAID